MPSFSTSINSIGSSAISPLSRTTQLNGGYDATLPDMIKPNTPIQFFILKGGMCPYAARTLIVLEELCSEKEGTINYDTTEIMTLGPKPDWFLRINPRGKVPALKIPQSGGSSFVVYESAICNEFLCDYFDSKSGYKQSLLPSDPLVRAELRLLNNQIDEILLPSKYTYLMNKDADKESELLEKFEDALMYFENKLQQSSAESDSLYFLGKDFSLSDIHLLPFYLRMVFSLKEFKNYDLLDQSTKFPYLKKWFETCSERASVKKSAKTEEEIIETYKKFLNMDYKFGGLNKNK